jgi:hypothetical protein
MMGDVSTGNSVVAPQYTKQYSMQLLEYANVSLNDAEYNTYKLFFNTIKDENGLTSVQDLMMLDMVVYDFIRAKRLQQHLHKHGDVITKTNDKGEVIFSKPNEAGQLLNAVESQLRQNMKELLITKKEALKKAIAIGDGDFANWLNAKVIDVEPKK